jgi:hypothetical protein
VGAGPQDLEEDYHNGALLTLREADVNVRTEEVGGADMTIDLGSVQVRRVGQDGGGRGRGNNRTREEEAAASGDQAGEGSRAADPREEVPPAQAGWVVIGPETRRVAKGGLVIEESSNRAMASRSVARGAMVKCNSCLSP